jgi:hypothetical protein
MKATEHRTICSLRLRAVLGLLLALTFLRWGADPVTPALADAPPDPAARLQVDIQQVYIYNDRDWGKGEMKLTLELKEFVGDSSSSLASLTYKLSANDNQVVTVEKSLPGSADSLANGVSAESGIPVYAGHRYGFVARMVEVDSFSNDNMGVVVALANEGNNWGIGADTVRSTHEGSGSAGDFNVTFEIKRAPLPDLKPTAVRLVDQAARLHDGPERGGRCGGPIRPDFAPRRRRGACRHDEQEPSGGGRVG